MKEKTRGASFFGQIGTIQHKLLNYWSNYRLVLTRLVGILTSISRFLVVGSARSLLCT